MEQKEITEKLKNRRILRGILYGFLAVSGISILMSLIGPQASMSAVEFNVFLIDKVITLPIALYNTLLGVSTALITGATLYNNKQIAVLNQKQDDLQKQTSQKQTVATQSKTAENLNLSTKQNTITQATEPMKKKPAKENEKVLD